MSVVGTITKTMVKLVYGGVQLIGTAGEGIYKLSTAINDDLVKLDNKLTKKFEKKEEKRQHNKT